MNVLLSYNTAAVSRTINNAPCRPIMSIGATVYATEAVHLAVMEFIRSIRREIREGPWSIDHPLSVSASPSLECLYSRSVHRSHVIHHLVRDSIRFTCGIDSNLFALKKSKV